MSELLNKADAIDRFATALLRDAVSAELPYRVEIHPQPGADGESVTFTTMRGYWALWIAEKSHWTYGRHQTYYDIVDGPEEAAFEIIQRLVSHLEEAEME